jgi:hypothetical protein
MYRAEAKKEKPTKMEKAYNYFKKEELRAEARKKAAETVKA